MNDETCQPPEAPLESDCCNSGCTPCVFDIYEKQLSEWKTGKMRGCNSRNMRHDLLSETTFKPFVLLKKIKITFDTYLLQFQPKLASDDLVLCDSVQQTITGLLPYAPGQHLVMKSDQDFFKHTNKDDLLKTSHVSKYETKNIVSSSGTSERSTNSKKEAERMFITRAYTPITLSDEEDDCHFDIIVKLYENGLMSKYIKTLCVSDVIYIRGPYGEFRYTANTYKIVLMMCIGTGIAPVYTVIKHILRDENDETVVKLLYGCRNITDILLRDELIHFASYWNFSLKYFVSGDVADSLLKKFGESFIFSRINEIDILKELSCSKSINDCLILICGTNTFSDMVLRICIENGVERKNIYVF